MRSPVNRSVGTRSARTRSRGRSGNGALDVVCAADPRLSSDFRRSGVESIEDVAVTNDGAWRHSVVKYLRQPRVRELLAELLGVPPPGTP